MARSRATGVLARLRRLSCPSFFATVFKTKPIVGKLHRRASDLARQVLKPIDQDQRGKNLFSLVMMMMMLVTVACALLATVLPQLQVKPDIVRNISTWCHEHAPRVLTRMEREVVYGTYHGRAHHHHHHHRRHHHHHYSISRKANYLQFVCTLLLGGVRAGATEVLKNLIMVRNSSPPQKIKHESPK